MIRVSNLTKYYGDFPALQDLSFEFGDGHVYGFLGPNGAGKSTAMNIMTGCLSPTSGTVNIGGYDILEQPEQAKKLIGYLPELPPLYMHETPREYLTFVGEAKGLRRKALEEDIERVIKSTGIEEVSDRVIGTLSKGYRQRVGIAQALLGKPEVIILDEPTVGLDPIQIIEIRDFIRDLGKDHTVILSSHILSEVQAVCEKVLILSKGKLVAFDTPENLEKLFLGSSGVTFRVDASEEEAGEILREEPGISGWEIKNEAGTSVISADFAEGQDAKTVSGKLTMAFALKGFPVFEMRTRKANLEDVFLELTETDEKAIVPSGTGTSGENVPEETSGEETPEVVSGEEAPAREPGDETPGAEPGEETPGENGGEEAES